MKRMLVVCALVGAILVPAALAADPAPADFKNAAKYCQAVRTSKGVEAFQAQYGTNKNKKNAFGKCVSSTNKAKASGQQGRREGRQTTRRPRMRPRRRQGCLQEAADRQRDEVRAGLQELRPVRQDQQGHQLVRQRSTRRSTKGIHGAPFVLLGDESAALTS